MRNAHIYQIYYNEASRQALDPNFIPLDNSANLRPDWSEYWVIRNFLLNNELKENDLYGFFSPKFKGKTGLSGEDVHRFIQAQSDTVDVIAFSPFWDNCAYFRNIFEQGEYWHHGLVEAMQNFVTAMGQNINISDTVTHSQNTIFANYFVATPRFWRRWLIAGETLFELAESEHLLAHTFNATTSHADSHTYPFKVFIQERMASLLLTTEKWGAVFYNTFELPQLQQSFTNCKAELIICDALKQAYSQTQQEQYLTAYYEARNKATEKHNQGVA